MIRSTRHHLKDLNQEKRSNYELFLRDYESYLISVFNEVWNNGYEKFSIKAKSLNIPKYINYKDFEHIPSNLSARAKSSAVTQVAQLVKSVVEKQRRVMWIKKNKNPNIKDKAFQKPKLKDIKPNLSSKCCDIVKLDNSKFWGFVKLKSIGRKYGEIKIPVIKNPRMRGICKSGILFSKNNIQISWEVPPNPIKKGDKIIGLDQGMKDVACLSDGQKTPEFCNHGHSLSSILDKLARKKKGSKAFNKAQKHRQNFVNYSINTLNFDGVKEVRLEKVVNIRHKRKSSRKMSHWSNPEIRDKIKSRCEELEVPVVEQSCAYRSQRCNQCGQVRKANRKSKEYSCENCGYCADADYNASLNHVVDLPDVPRAFLGQKLNLGNGFFWKPEGFFNFDGSELRVPNSR